MQNRFLGTADPGYRAALAPSRLVGKRLAKGCVTLLVSFPLVDYTLRQFVHPLGSIWDKVVLAVLALVALNRVMRGHRPQVFAWSKYAGWYITYLIALLFMGLGNPGTSFDGFRADIYDMLFGLLLPFVVEPEDAPYFLYVAAALAMLIGLDGVLQYVLAVPIPPGWVDVGEHVRTRVFSVLKSPNELGAYMETMAPLIIGMGFAEKNRVRKIIFLAGGFFCLVTLLLTYTRGAWLGLGVGVVLVALAFERRLLAVVVVLGVIGFFLPPIHHRVMDLFSQVYYIKSSQGGRLVRWQQAFDQLAGSPLFGAGLGRYGGAVASDKGLSIYSDNYYAKVLGESGLVGLVLFFALHVRIVVEVVQKVVRRAVGAHRPIALGGLIGVIALLVHNVVENVFEYPANCLNYFLMVGLLLLWSRTFAGQEENHG
ncbi:O-antigen ligase family protein [Alicyclobacillus acidocaldarius]|uniref:O-antigen polymerase n=1 Tax=Alicyclobacillus acidocaldarius (strain Tc-4-1) TaxID=1048834 RepID=F8IHU1_ALIAT|nr:O-antigen ligase family protein [Alicyclobacillus acidocaldarius]AEJ43231.1 O-antigen polymerase [Alicyclobacillus acidocaldarius subsp. acidocaldarius Tc-4-1]